MTGHEFISAPWLGNQRFVRTKVGSLLEWANWWVTPRPTPSFVHKYTVYREVYSRALANTKRDWGTLWGWEMKDGVADLAALVGLHVPERYTEIVPIEQLDFHELPDTFAVKPIVGSSRAGVFVLRKEGEAYRDLLRGSRSTTEAEVKRRILELGRAGQVSADRTIAERALVDGDRIAFDWKIYSFQGQTPLVLQIYRGVNGRQSCYYDGEWNRLGDIRRGKKSSAALPLPVDPAGLLRAASAVSTALPLPFARIDLYEFDGFRYLGEITPMPGSSQRFTRAIDRSLGEAWEAAEASLLVADRPALKDDPIVA